MNTYTSYPISAFITHLVYLQGGEVEVDVEKITVCSNYQLDVLSMLDIDVGIRLWGYAVLKSSPPLIHLETVRNSIHNA